jgi:hypothetical protein
VPHAMKTITIKMKNKKNIKAILLSPLIGELVFILVLFINNQIDKIFLKEFDVPMFNEKSFFAYLFSIFLLVSILFQIIILEPVFRRLKRKNKLNKKTMIIISTTLIMLFSLTFALIFGTIQFGIKDYLYALIIGIVIWTSYFASNFTTYYLISIKQKE